MIARKKRRLVIIMSIVLVVAIIIAAVIALYLNTDMFKSNKTLFLKYVGKNIENLQETTQYMNSNISTTDFDSKLEGEFYNNDTIMKANYIENKGTSLENTNNIINKLQLNLNTKINKSNQYEYKNVNLTKEEENLLNVQYLKENNNCGIKIDGIQEQYLIEENTDMEKLSEKIGYNLEENIKIPDIEKVYSEILKIIELTEEEKINLQDKIINFFSQNISNESFSKKSNVTISIDEKNVYADAYELTLTKEQLNAFLIKFLEMEQEDEILLNKVDQIEAVIEENFGEINDGVSLRETLLELIKEKIEEINKNNIGKEETKIIVYENQRNTVKFEIQTQEYVMAINWLTDESMYFAEFEWNDEKTRSSYKARTNNGKTSIEIEKIEDEQTEDEKIEIMQLSKTIKIEDDKSQKTVNALYEDDSNKIEASIQSVDSIINEQDIIKDDSGDAVVLNNLEGEELETTTNQIKEAIAKKKEELEAIIVQTEIQKPLMVSGLLKEEKRIEFDGISEIEKVRYNSQFEILKGEKLKGDNILTTINAIKNNLNGLEIISNTKLKLIIDRNNKNEEIATTLTEFINKNKSKEYKVDVQYDENGLVNSMLLEILEKE